MTEESIEQHATIQWFPGHMTKALREVKNKINLVDVVVEVRDARLPTQSGNPKIDEILGSKKKIVILNKADLADKDQNQLWSKHFQEAFPRVPHFFINSNDSNTYKKLIPTAQNMMREKWEKWKKKGIRPPVLRMMLIGLPNTGKSTIINRLAKKKKAATGNRPGITTNQQWIVVNEDVELLDTPGIMPPKVESLEQGLNLALIKAIREGIVEKENLENHLEKIFSTRKEMRKKEINFTLEKA